MRKKYYKTLICEWDISGTESWRAIIRNDKFEKVATEFFLSEEEANQWVLRWIEIHKGVLCEV